MTNPYSKPDVVVQRNRVLSDAQPVRDRFGNIELEFLQRTLQHAAIVPRPARLRSIPGACPENRRVG